MRNTYRKELGSSVSTITRLPTGQLGNRCSIPSRATILFFTTASRLAMSPTSLLPDVNRRLFPSECCDWGLKLNTHLQVVLTSQKPGATHPLFQYSYRSVYSLTGTNLNLTLNTVNKICDSPTTAAFSLSEITR